MPGGQHRGTVRELTQVDPRISARSEQVFKCKWMEASLACTAFRSQQSLFYYSNIATSNPDRRRRAAGSGGEAASYRQERKLGLWAAVLCQVDSHGVGSENHGQESLSNFECFRQSQSIRRKVRTINL